MNKQSIEEAPSPPRKRRNRRGEAARAGLIDATIVCLNRSGYAATSIEEVMSESGLGRGSVLNQFPTRLELMLAASEQAMVIMVNHARSQLEAIDHPVMRLYALADAAWESHNLPEAIAVTEILLASRWDNALAHGLRTRTEPIDLSIDRLNGSLARGAGIKTISEFLIHGRLLNSNFRGLTIELMFNDNRKMIHRAIAAQKDNHKRLCDRLLAERT